jgi:three-Cys-motif partner protein
MKGDANQLVDSVMTEIPDRSYVFAFADIEAPKHWRWASVERLRRSHRSLDLYMLFRWDMGLVRLAGYSAADRRKWARILTPFFGTDEWARIAERLRGTDAQAPVLRAEMVALYISRLRTLWQHAGSVALLKRPTGQPLYEMFFASGADVAQKIAESAGRAMGREDDRGQFNLDLRS